MSDIVQQIIANAKARIPLVCTDFQTEVDYVYDLQMNSAEAMDYRFGFIPLSAPPTSGSQGAKRFDHTFQVILTREVENQDCDKDMQQKIESLYPCMFQICKDFQANCLYAGTPQEQLIQVKDGGFDIPEILGENEGVALRMNLVFQYQLRK